MKINIDGEEFNVDPFSLQVQDTDVVFVDKCAVRESYTRQVLMDCFLSKVFHSCEPVPVHGLQNIYNATKLLQMVALLACHYDLHPKVFATYTKICSHFSECCPEPGDLHAKQLVVDTARMLCDIRQTMENYRNAETYGQGQGGDASV